MIAAETRHERTFRRPSGDWLAVAPRESQLQIGVVGDTEGSALRALADAMQRWREIIASGQGGNRQLASRGEYPS